MARGKGRPKGICRPGRLAGACVAVALVHHIHGAAATQHVDSGISPGTIAANESISVLNGYRRYHASCNHCHGPDGIGSSFGPGLIETPLNAEAFREAVLNGRSSGLSVMKGFAQDPNVEPYIADIFTYLRARSLGQVGRGRPRSSH